MIIRVLRRWVWELRLQRWRLGKGGNQSWGRRKMGQWRKLGVGLGSVLGVACLRDQQKSITS